MRNNKLRSVLLAILVTAGSGAYFFHLINSKPAAIIAKEQEKIWPVETNTADIGTNSPQVMLLGHVESSLNSQLTAAVEGDVLNTWVSEGEHVKKGQLLIGLDPVESEMNKTLRAADVENLQAQITQENNEHKAAIDTLEHETKLLDLSKAALEREMRLRQRKLGTESQLDQTRIALEQRAMAVRARQLLIANHNVRLKRIRANLKRAQSLLQRATLDLQRTQITAPFDGRVNKLHVSTGERVTLGSPLINIYSLDNMEVRALIPERYLASLMTRNDKQNLSPIIASFDYAGKNFDLSISRFTGEVNKSSGGTDAIFKVTGPTSLLPIGKPIDFTMNLPAMEQTVVLPISAIFDGNKIFIIDENSRLFPVNITKVGESKQIKNQSAIIAISDSLKTGDTYITTQLPNPVKGLKVSVVNNI